MSYYPIPALRHERYVYVRNLKCASTFFYKNLFDMGWYQVDLDSATDNDIIFSHILDPIQRRHQGMAEYIAMSGLAERFCHDEKLQDLLRYAPVLDRHSLPYQWSFGSWVDRIDWIPLHGSNEDNIIRTQNWLNSRGLKIDLLPKKDRWVHQGDSTKKQVVKILERNWKIGPQPVEMATQQQREWKRHYNDIKDTSWPEAPHFREFHLLPERIRKELAQKFPTEKVQVAKDLTWVNISIDEYPTNFITQCEIDIFANDMKLWQKSLEKFGILLQ